MSTYKYYINESKENKENSLENEMKYKDYSFGHHIECIVKASNRDPFKNPKIYFIGSRDCLNCKFCYGNSIRITRSCNPIHYSIDGAVKCGSDENKIKRWFKHIWWVIRGKKSQIKFIN